MGGRHAKPVKLQLLEGNKGHLTKEEIKIRTESEIKLGDKIIYCPHYVRSDTHALQRWMQVKKVFKTISDDEIITSADTDIIARYCVAYSDYIDLVNRRRALSNMDNFNPNEEDDVLDEFEDNVGKFQAKKLWKKVEYILSTNGILGIDKAINQKMGSILSMEDRLYLNPLSRIKNVPKAEPKKKLTQKDRDDKVMFGD